jgi:hypothetical protein
VSHLSRGFSQQACHFLVGRDAGLMSSDADHHSSETTDITQGDCLWDCLHSPGTAARVRAPAFVLIEALCCPDQPPMGIIRQDGGDAS